MIVYEAFCDMLVGQVERALAGCATVVHADGVLIITRNNNEADTHIQEFRLDVQRWYGRHTNGEPLDQAVAIIVGIFHEQHDLCAWESVVSQLMLRIEQLDDVGAWQASVGEENKIIAAAWTADLVVTCWIDMDTSMIRVSQKHVDGWGKTREEVLFQAAQNTIRRWQDKPLQCAAITIQTGPETEEEIQIWRSEYGDGYDVTALLVEGYILDQLGVDEAIVMIPSRDVLWAVPKHEIDRRLSVGVMLQLFAMTIHQTGVYPVSSALYLVTRDHVYTIYIAPVDGTDTMGVVQSA
jgi:hypothetical protein